MTALLLLPAFTLSGQTPESLVLETSTMKAVFNSNGALFTDFQKGGFITPYLPGQAEHSLMRVAGLWIAGLDAAGNLRGATQLYNEAGQADFVPGLPDGTLSHIWRVTRDEVHQHNIDLLDDDELDYLIPDIYAWPGKGNPYFAAYNPGQASLPDDLAAAPFLDYDYDGSYNPDKGDSPYFTLPFCNIAAPPTEMAWFPFHSGVQPTESGMAPLPLEVYCTIALHDCPADPRAANTVFIHYVMINRSGEPLHNLYAGMFNDFDIGNPDDDFFGCDTARSLVYAYNGDALDENGFGAYPPAIGVDLLSGPLGADGQPLPLGSVQPVDFSALNEPSDYYNLLKGLNPDGSTAPQNGFYYQTDLDSGVGFSEVQAQNTPGNRKVLFSTGPFDLAPGAVNQMTVAYTFGTGDGSLYSGLGELLNQNQSIQSFFDECMTFHDGPGCLNLLPARDVQEKQTFDVFPNPSSGRFTVEALETPFRRLTLADPTGRIVLDYTWQEPVTRAEVGTDDIPEGLYTVQVITDKQAVVQQLLVMVR